MSEPPTASLRIRSAVRAVLVDPDDRVLLVQFAFPRSLDAPADEPRRVVWATPGGGAESGEHPHDTLRRELHEELGHHVDEIGPEVWHRTIHIPFIDGSHDGQHDRYFLVRCEPFDPEPAIGWEQLRAEYVHEVRWWTLTELSLAEAAFAPRRMAHHVEHLLSHGPPPSPIDVSH